MKSKEDGFVLRYRIFGLQHAITLQELSKASGLSVQRLSHIELLDLSLTPATKSKMIRALEITIWHRNAAAAAAMADFLGGSAELFELVPESEYF